MIELEKVIAHAGVFVSFLFYFTVFIDNFIELCP